MKVQGSFKALKVIPDDRRIADFWIAPWGWAAVTAAIEVGLTEALHKGAQAPHVLAGSLGLHPLSTESILRVMVAMGFAHEKDKVFGLAPDARAYLVPSCPLSRLAELSKHFETPEHKWIVRKLREITPILRTFGDTWRENPDEDAAVKDAAAGMDSVIKAPSTAVVRSKAFQGVEHILDVGGGSGAFAVTLTEHQPETRVTILDLPAMCKQAQSWVEKRGAKNIDFHPADFFKDAWAQGCDAIYLSNVLHDWPLKDVQILLQLARATVEDKPRHRGRLYVLEVLRNENRNGPLMATIFHMQMQMGFGGAQYTRSDFGKLFQEAGFSGPRVVARFGYYSLLRAHAL
ncbi:MAG: methyltransferase domain-containing protein [Pseudobdellovibrionaceae bacterium]|nr:methyltransferase domain-containing protein [Pseudobdellovibrionaceae bacterium]